MLNLLLKESSDRLDIIKHKWVLVRAIRRGATGVYWDHDGLLGKVPISVVKDAFDLWRAYRAPKFQPRMARMVPPGVGFIEWEQATPVSGPKTQTSP